MITVFYMKNILTRTRALRGLQASICSGGGGVCVVMVVCVYACGNGCGGGSVVCSSKRHPKDSKT